MSDTTLIRKTIRLPEEMWQAINRIRRQSAGTIPPEIEVIRQLLNEALHHRHEAATAARKLLNEARKEKRVP